MFYAGHLLVLFGVGAFAAQFCHDCLMLTPLIEAGKHKQARLMSIVEPTKFLGIKSHSGYITVNKEYKSNLFFWFFPCLDRSRVNDSSWVLWLNGGPGVSSLTGLFKSIGPLQVVNGKLEFRKVTWNSNYSLLFVDSPVGAGFSFTQDQRGYPNNVDKVSLDFQKVDVITTHKMTFCDVSSDLYEFLRQFTKMFPSLVGASFFIAGSSYSGKYVPSLAYRVHVHKDEIPFNLKGIILGNALIDPRHMMHYSALVEALGFMDESQLQQLRTLEQCVVQLIEDGLIYNASNKFNETVEFIKKTTDVSVYNFDQDPNKNAPEFEAFVNRINVRRWIHAGNATFDYNNQLVYQIMLPDIMNTSKPLLEDLLENYGVLSYSGQYDIIIAYSLSRHAYAALEWSRKEQYRSAKRRRLRTKNDGVVGYRKSGGNLVEVLIRRAGHDAAGDRPGVVKYVVDEFISLYQ